MHAVEENIKNDFVSGHSESPTSVWTKWNIQLMLQLATLLHFHILSYPAP